MAILRCNKCGHVAEVAGENIGKSVGCPQCAQEVPVYDTVLFVRKVLKQYFLLQGEVVRLSAAATEPSDAMAPPARAAALEIDLHNTSDFASDAQHEGILQWLERRQLKVRVNTEAVDTTGFFDEIAVELGDNYALLREVVDKIRWGQQKDVPNFSINHSKISHTDSQAINAFCKRLYEYSLLGKYFYQKTEKIGRGTIQTAPAVRNFFAGEWLEWYAFMKSLAVIRDGSRDFSCARNLSVVFPNEDLHELDVFFLVGGAIPICIECKTGEFRRDIDTYLVLRKRLGLDRSQFILCVTGLSDEQAAGLSSMYELSFVNPAGLASHVARLL